MSQVELAKRYAKALLQLGHQNGKAKEYVAQIKSVADVLGSKEAASFFTNTAVTFENKKKSLDSLFVGAKFDDDVRGFLYLLLEKSRMPVLSDIVGACQELLDAEDGITRGKIRSLAALPEAVKSDYEKKIGQILNKKIYLDPISDEKVMGGVRIEIGGWTFDDSLETHLNQLGENLLKV